MNRGGFGWQEPPDVIIGSTPRAADLRKLLKESYKHFDSIEIPYRGIVELVERNGVWVPR